MQLLHFHCVWVRSDKVFRLTVGQPVHEVKPGLQRALPPQVWDLTPAEFDKAISGAVNQLTDTTDAVVEYILDLPVGGIAFKYGREAFADVVAYLKMVYKGWYEYEKNR